MSKKKEELEFVNRHYLRSSKNANEEVNLPDNEYAGTSDPNREIIRRAVYDNPFVEQELVTVINGIKKQETLHKIEVDIEFKDRAARFTGNQKPKDLEPIVLTPTVMELQEEWDFLNLRNSWFAQNPGTFNDRIPRAVVEQAIMTSIDELVPRYNSAILVRGKSRSPYFNITPTYLGYEEIIATATDSKKYVAPRTAITAITNVGDKVAFTVGTGLGANYEIGDYITATGIGNGTGNTATKLNDKIFNQGTYNRKTTENIYITEIQGDVLVSNVDITDESITIGTPVYTNAKLICINASNVVTVLRSIWRMVPEALRNNPNWNFWVHPYILDCFVDVQAQRLGNQLITPLGFTQNDLNILSMKLKRVPEMSPNTIVGIARENALYGVDDITDSNTFNITDLFATTNEELWRLRMSMAHCAVIAKTNEALIVR
jgi:hypothetical protein